MLNQLTIGDIRAAVDAVRGETEQLLCDLLRYPSTPGLEAGAMDYAAERFATLGDVECIALSDALRDDEDYADPLPGLTYDGRCNVRVRVPGRGAGKSLLLNTHLDVVPPSQGQDSPWEPRVEDGVVFGRGACDAKGQAAAIFMALSALKKLDSAPKGDLIAHLVVEEEVGGNGTLAMARRGERADACIVLEPTDLRIFSS
ncbi:MAG TPA: M20/M25/M40 family metallo-hydrolase, partial [Armatimonadota bacterium]|nr:M20/M25/M40 family metallo-hydrolase [Armatimonadota bacterium]